jgi:hypothetical protein
MAISGKSANEFARTASIPAAAIPAAAERGLDLEEIDPAPVSFDPQKDQAWVVGPQIFSFVHGVTTERREMIATSELFASLVADNECTRDQVEKWYSSYSGALTKLGWVIQESARRSFDQEHQGSKVHEAIIGFIATLGVGATALAIITAALKSMQKVDGGKPWITLFDRQTRREEITGFQIGLVDQSAEADFEVKLMSFTLKLGQTKTQVLFIDFATLGVHMDSIGSTVTVAEAVLREAMPTLQNRLKEYVKAYVSEVKLPPLH